MTDPRSERYKEALRLGHTAVVRGRPREAIEHYQEAARLAGGRPLPFLSMGNVYLQMQRPHEALAAFDEALRRAPEDVTALRGKAAAHQAAGQRAEAAAVGRRAAEIEARLGVPARGSAAAQPRGGEGPFSRAVAARSAGDARGATSAFLDAARAYADGHADDAALDACHRALETSPGALPVHLAMAELYLRRGWPEKAAERLILLERLTVLDDDRATRAAVRELAARHRAEHPALERIAAQGR
jgi:tetratricopeptide (TPR) repeat protein